jgi:hypothetical protein
MTDLSERWMEAWVDRAQRFTLRRLREDVDQALLVCETDFTSFLGSGGIPADREVVADGEGEANGPGVDDREIGASQSAPRETSAVRAYIDAEVVRALRALICTVQRRLERATGRLPTKGEALDNRVTLCAFHHLRGVHAGIIRCTGKAPHRLRITLGVRPDQPDRPPIATYASGDRLVAAL